MKCKFEKAWIGKCDKESDGELCHKHKDIICCSCGEQATRECSKTSQFVCGAPLCINCEHTICDNGCHSGGKRPEGLGNHCKIKEQVYKPWYTEEIGDEVKIIYENNKPYGIRDNGGYLFFFTDIAKYSNQEERYRTEIEEQYELADFLLNALKNR